MRKSENDMRRRDSKNVVSDMRKFEIVNVLSHLQPNSSKINARLSVKIDMREPDSKIIPVFGTFPNMRKPDRENVVSDIRMSEMSDSKNVASESTSSDLSFPPKANNVIYPAPAQELNSPDLRAWDGLPTSI